MMKWIGRIFVGAVLLLGLTYGVLWYITREPQRPVTTIPESGKLLITGATIVDPVTGDLASGQAVLIDKGRIVSVGENDLVADNAKVTRIDVAGKFLVPGFNDMHAHPLGSTHPEAGLALMLANGITGFRQMSGSDAMLRERRESRLPLGKMAPAVLAMPGALLTPLNASKPDQVRQTIRDQKAAGADFIKAGLVSGPVLFAALDEARKDRIPLAGHVPAGVDIVDAAESGMHAIEHLGPANGLLIACAAGGDRILADVAASASVPSVPAIKSHIVEKLAEWALLERVINPAAADHEAGGVEPMERALANFDETRCRASMRKLRASGSWQVPTLIRLKAIYLAGDPEFTKDPNLAYMSEETLADWRRVTANFDTLYSRQERATMRKGYDASLRLVKMLDEEGVPMLAGSDASGGGWEVPGFALHREFDELARAGLSPLRILQMTTSDPARFLQRGGSMGRIMPGAAADMVLLDGDPTADVRNLHRISAVVRAGYFHDRDDLDRLLSRAVGAVN